MGEGLCLGGVRERPRGCLYGPTLAGVGEWLGPESVSLLTLSERLSEVAWRAYRA